MIYSLTMNSLDCSNQTKVNKLTISTLLITINLFLQLALILNLLHNKNNIQSQIIGSNAAATTSLDQQNTAIMTQYQQIIREQDTRIKQEQQEKLQLAQTCAQLQEYCHSLHSALSSKDDYLKERTHELDSFSSDKLKMHAKINELEVKNNLLEEK